MEWLGSSIMVLGRLFLRPRMLGGIQILSLARGGIRGHRGRKVLSQGRAGYMGEE